MKANERRLSEIIFSPSQYVIPVFQRYYVWENDSWNRLWEDLILLLESEEEKSHFLGSIVCIPELNPPGAIAAFQLIDGQQRLITISVLLCAIRDCAKKMGWNELAAEVEENFLIHRFKKGRERYKIYPRMKDRDRYIYLIDDQQNEQLSRINLAYNYFTKEIESKDLLNDEDSLRRIFTIVTEKLDFVVITLQGENPYKIFRSLNSTGVDLEQSDLIRNHVFTVLPIDEQDLFDEQHWNQIEVNFETKGKINSSDLTAFFRDFLMMTGKYVLERDVFETFIKRYPSDKIQPKNLVLELKSNAKRYYCIRGEENHKNTDIQNALKMIRELSIGTSYPLLLTLFEMYDNQKINSLELEKALRAISSFVLRRFICKLTNRRYGNWFSEACKYLEDKPLQNLFNYLIGKEWPTDEEFITNFQKFDLYSSKYARPVIQGLEIAQQASSEPVTLDNCTIEHIMPQTIEEDNYGFFWMQDLGEDWQRIHRTWLHTPGNLTLVWSAYNIDMKNKPFITKKLVFEESRVYLNKYFTDSELIKWGEEEIINRGIDLAKIAAKVWSRPDS